MADIFISYKKEDAGRVVRIVEGLRAEGFTVWWDHGIAPGTSWDQEIQRELDAAKAVVAVWSDDSIDAPWVKEEANVGKSRGALVPVRIDDVEPPLGFGLIQFADLIDWDGDIEDPHWDFFIESVRAVLDGKPIAGLEKPQRKRGLPFIPILVGLVFLVMAGGAGVFFIGDQRTPEPSAPTGPGSGSASASTAPEITAPSEAEETLFLAAQETRLKTDYQDFLRSFPQGYYAKRVREEILPLCEGEMRPAWKPNPVPIGQVFRASSQSDALDSESLIHPTEAAACAQAKVNYEEDAERYCRTIAGSSEFRELQLNVQHADCACRPSGDGFYCFIDSNYSCSYEFLTEEYVEVCG